MRVIAVIGFTVSAGLTADPGTAGAVAATAPSPTATPTVSPPRRPLSPDDFFQTKILTEPEVSPDGQWVAYVVTTNDRDADESRSAVWMVSWDGGQQVQLTNAAHDTSAPRWSPDGRYVSYLATAAGAEKAQIMLLDRRGGESRALTSVSDDIEDYEWSPDGKRIVIAMETDTASVVPAAPAAGAAPAAKPTPKPIVIDSLHFKEDKDGYLGNSRQRHLYLLDVGTRRLEPLTAGSGFNEDLPTWSPDGQRIAFVRTRDKAPDPDGMADIDSIAARAGAVATRVVRNFVPNQQKVTWSPDGQYIAYVQGLEPKYSQYSQDRLALVPAAGGTPRPLTDGLDRGISSFAFAPDSKSITVTVEDDTTAYPASVDLRTDSLTKLATGPFVLTELSSAGGRVVALYCDDSAPAEVYALEAGHLRKLTNHNDSFLAQIQLGRVEDFRFRSRDGTGIHGLMVTPPGFVSGRKYPTLLWVHGGPNLQDEHALSFDGYQFKRQLLAAQGFVVVGINYRGGSGRGTAFSKAIFADWGHKEVEDLTAGLDDLVTRGISDPDRLGIGGWSYGGILTDYMIATSPRFKAAVSGAGTANPLAMYGSDEYDVQYNNELGVPWRNTGLWLKLSYPFLHAERIHTPTLFMGGDKDFNVPINGGEQMYLALRTLGIPAQLIVYPGQYHTLTRPSFLKDRAERLAAWYGKYLGVSVAPQLGHQPQDLQVQPDQRH